MSDLKELHITDSNIRLENHIVKGGILPNKISELTRTVSVVGKTIVEGPLYANKLTIEAAPLNVTGAVFTQHEIYINNDVSGDINFNKAVGSASSIVSRSSKCNLTFRSDINAKSITLCNAFGPPVEQASATNLFFPVAFNRLKLAVAEGFNAS